MPFYRFHLETHEPVPLVIERLKAIVRPKPGFWESFRMIWPVRDPSSPPFIGKVETDTFRVRRDIRYRNSFLPMVWGRVEPAGVGTRVTVTMFLHPLVALFMVFWFGMTGSAIRSAQPLIGWGFVLFGIALVLSGFIPEAIKAKRLISNAVLGSTLLEQGAQTSTR